MVCTTKMGGTCFAGCSKRLSSKAAANESLEAYPLVYVEGLNDARTKLADVLSILLPQPSPLRESGSLPDSLSPCIRDIPDDGVLDENAASC